MTSPLPKLRPVTSIDQIRFCCPLCSTVLEIPREKAGSKGPCPNCSATIVAPMVVESAKPKRTGKQPIQFQENEATSAELSAAAKTEQSVNADLPEPELERSAEKRAKRSKRPPRHRSAHPAMAWIRSELWFLLLLVAVIAIGIGAIIIAGR